MKTPLENINLDSFEYVSNELREEFTNIFIAIDDAIVIE